MKLVPLSVMAICAQVAVAEAQPRVLLVDRGPGASGRILSEVLGKPYRLVEPDTSGFTLPRNERVGTTLLVLGRRTAIDGQVDGDVVVVGGDLFIHPGARIRGRAVAIGGGVYPSTLALSIGGVLSFRDNTFVIARTTSGYELSYQSLYADASPAFRLPGIYGLRGPSYDRVNGVSVPVGPAFSFAGGRGEANIIATYRSDLGKIDPSADATVQLNRRLRIESFVGRGTFSNDEWIWSDYVNSLSSLVVGKDTRNYYRADRGEASLHYAMEGSRMSVEPFVGARLERSWSVGPGRDDQGSPWSILGRTDTVDGMRRPNPPVPELDIASALAGSDLRWQSGGVKADARLIAEHALRVGGSPEPENNAFTQLTFDLNVTFLTFGEQLYEIDVHHVTTPQGVAPPQRFAYLGGSGTLPFLDLLEQGGAELVFVDQRYSVPIPRFDLRLLGIPTLQLRHRIGGAGLERLPRLEQALSVGVLVSILRVELVIDPATRETRFSVGLSFAR